MSEEIPTPAEPSLVVSPVTELVPKVEPEKPKLPTWQYYQITAKWTERTREHPFGIERIKFLPRFPARDFMDAIRRAQQRFPGATISLRNAPK